MERKPKSSGPYVLVLHYSLYRRGILAKCLTCISAKNLCRCCTGWYHFTFIKASTVFPKQVSNHLKYIILCWQNNGSNPKLFHLFCRHVSICSFMILLRTVPIIVSAHTFCASRKTWFKRMLGLTLTQSTTLLIKVKFSYFDQIKFNEPILKPGTPK